MTKLFDTLSMQEKDDLVAYAKQQAIKLVPHEGNIGYSIRDISCLTAEEKQHIADNQLHLKMDDSQLRELTLRHVEGLTEKANLQQGTGGGRKFYFPGDPASKRILLKKLREGGDLKGLQVAQRWIEATGHTTVDGLFYLDAQDVRNRLYADTDVQHAISLDTNRLSKVRAMGSGVHSAAELAVKIAESKGYICHELNTDDVCMDWPTAETDIRDHLEQRAPKDKMYFVAMLLTPEEAKQEADHHTDIPMSHDAVAKKAQTFAQTLQKILLPDYQNILLVDKDLNVVLHREGGKDVNFNEAAYGQYLRACGVDMNQRGGSGQAKGIQP